MTRKDFELIARALMSARDTHPDASFVPLKASADVSAFAAYVAALSAAAGTITLAQLKSAVHALGLVVTHSDGELRVNFRGGKEATAYYTSDRADALGTAYHMHARLSAKRSEAFDVYLHGKCIDTVFATGYDCEEMRRSLINHDAYDAAITVRKAKG